ncbi:MAG TPA: amidohydrolase family protein [Caulobacterales bacterium]|nr:amidohydrolase family protein [Caulobacterales bacterium]
MTVAEPPIVDSHVHIFTQDMPLVAHAWNKPAYSFTAEDLLATLDAHGVHFAVIAGISLYGYYNDYMIAKLKQYPRLRGTVNISPTIDRGELQAMKEAGVVGMRLFLSSQLSGEVADIRGEDYQRLFRRVRDLDWHIHFLAQDDVFADALAVLRSAGVKLVIDHFSNPAYGEGPNCAKVAAALKAMESGDTWMKISAGFRFSPRAAQRTLADYARARETEAEFDRFLLDRADHKRLLWGSDCPFVGHESAVRYQDTLDSFYHAVPDARMRRQISDNALNLYFS